MDLDALALIFLLFVVITVLMYPPGPGSPLPDRVPSR